MREGGVERGKVMDEQGLLICLSDMDGRKDRESCGN